MPSLTLSLLPESYAICRFPPAANVMPPGSSAFSLIVRAADETTLVCPEDQAPPGARIDPGWRCLRIEQTFDFSIPGILASVLQPLASAKIGIFATSTFSTDYVLVKATDLEGALDALTGAGHAILR